MKKGTVPTAELMTNGQVLDIASALVQAAPRLINRRRANELIKDKSVWQDLVRDFFSNATETEPDIACELEFWERHYAQVYEWRLNLGRVAVPSLPIGKFRRPKLLLVDPALKLNRIFEVGVKAFPAWRYADDLDGACAKESSRPQEVYAVWTEGAVEPSEEYANLSPDQLDERKLTCQIIRERMLLEHSHFLETGGGHLDLVNVIITSSRDSGGGAFCAYWGGRQFRVDWWHRAYARPDGRVREVVLPL